MVEISTKTKQNLNKLIDAITLQSEIMDLKTDYETSISETNLPRLMGLSRFLDDRLNRSSDPHAPYVGAAAFAHKGGLHASAAQKDPRTYEHIPPEKVGNERQYLVSDQAGRSNMLARFAMLGIEIDANDKRIDRLIRVVKEKEFEGWAFDSAEASFELLARRMLDDVPDFFRIGRFRVMDERRFNARGDLVVESEATATIFVGDQSFHEAAVGNGPVNAVDTAMRKALVAAYPTLAEVELVDYKVRILDAVGELINQIAKIQYMSSGRIPMPILLRGCIGIGHSAATHHSGSYYPMYSQVPGLRVVVPSTPYDAKGLMKRALNCDEPVLFLEHRELLNVAGPVPEEEYEIPFGKAAVLREGKDATVVALTTMVHKANAAIDILSHEGYSVELIDPRTVSPLDIETIASSVAKTGRLFVAEENFGPCGVASEIAAQIADVAFDELDAPIRRLFGEFTPTPYSPTLEAAVIPSQDDVTNAIRAVSYTHLTLPTNREV